MTNVLIYIEGRTQCMNKLALLCSAFECAGLTMYFATGKSGRVGCYRRNVKKFPEQVGAEVRGDYEPKPIDGDFRLSIGVEKRFIYLDVPAESLAAFAPAMQVVAEMLQHIDFGYLMPSRFSHANGWYSMGMCLYGRPGDEEVSRWSQHQAQSEGFDGRLRDIYPVNFYHRRFNELDTALRLWKNDHPEHVIWHEAEGLVCFEVQRFAARERLRQYIRDRGLLVCQAPFPGDGPDVDELLAGVMTADLLAKLSHGANTEQAGPSDVRETVIRTLATEQASNADNEREPLIVRARKPSRPTLAKTIMRSVPTVASTELEHCLHRITADCDRLYQATQGRLSGKQHALLRMRLAARSLQKHLPRELYTERAYGALQVAREYSEGTLPRTKFLEAKVIATEEGKQQLCSPDPVFRQSAHLVWLLFQEPMTLKLLFGLHEVISNTLAWHASATSHQRWAQAFVEASERVTTGCLEDLNALLTSA